MFLVIGSILISGIILLFFWLKSLSKKQTEGWFPPNEELESYYNLTNVSITQKQKALLAAAVTTIQRIEELENERDPVFELSQDHIISFDLLNFFEKSISDLEVEKMVICSEADSLKDDWSNSIFREAEVMASKIKKIPNKKVSIDEALFNKKRETLEKKIQIKLGLINEVNKI
ncbi:hypothetical protein H312_02945 [Anncaliia algerae PRA339]|uniref:Uncharacterized protein n=1 Tax=Anncaliia algerae PRA339 TaxID=1288291 RepID=A0A059EXS7_9MICR|nr:hypothetical protein H312_02945 [Anncaliia algerae PRA339]